VESHGRQRLGSAEAAGQSLSAGVRRVGRALVLGELARVQRKFSISSWSDSSRDEETRGDSRGAGNPARGSESLFAQRDVRRQCEGVVALKAASGRLRYVPAVGDSAGARMVTIRMWRLSTNTQAGNKSSSHGMTPTARSSAAAVR
jgi:hypothetical protein